MLLYSTDMGNSWYKSTTGGTEAQFLSSSFGYSYNEPNHPEGIQAIWEDVDTVKLEDDRLYHQIRISQRIDQEQSVYSLYDTCYIRQDVNTVIVKNISGKENFLPEMNFEVNLLDYTYISSTNLFNHPLMLYRIGGPFFAHFITDSLGFTGYNWREQRHGYGGFISNLNGCILDGIEYGGTVTDYTVVIKENERLIPSEFNLAQNYPNPFNPTTTINYSIPLVGFVTLKVYDILGREITVLVNEEKSPGNYQVIFNGGNLSSGVYLYTIHSGSFSETKKFLLMK